MPIYEYKCQTCGSAFEKLLATATSDPGACPACEGRTLTRLLSVFGIATKAEAPAPPPCAQFCGAGGRCPRQEG